MGEAAWVAVGGSTDLAPRSVMPAIVRGTEMVVWRDADGAVHAWRNRCPHRGMRLSFGFVDGDGRLACRYHGWRYGPDGRCAAVPAHPDLPPPAGVSVPAFASGERDGLIWVARAGETAPPGIAAPGETAVFCRSVVVRAPLEATGRTVAAGGGAGEPAPGVIRTVADGEAVIAALQPIDAARTGLHLLAVASGRDTVDLRLAVAAWGRRLRAAIEAEGPRDG